MPSWPESPRLIGSSITRVDGLAKATGRAKYPSDVHPKGLLFGVLLSSPHAHAKVKAIDVEPARKMPGVKAVLALATAGESTVFYQGQEIAAVAAETEEKARDAARAIRVEYEVLPHVVTEGRSASADAPKVFPAGNTRAARAQTTGKPDEAMQQAEVTIEATYELPVITHLCLETHGLTAEWKGTDAITVYSSTQSVSGVANDMVENLGLDASNVTVLTEVMGGGFGSKFNADVWGIAAAKLAKEAGLPVRMFLDRAQEHLIGGNRPSARADVKLGATKDGQLVAMVAETSGTGGRGGSNFPLPYVYRVDNRSRTHTEVFVNCGSARAMRAPGHPQGCAVMEAAMDDLADKLGMNPLEFRLKNLAEADMVAGGINRTDIYKEQLERGARLIGWDRWKPRGQGGDGPIKRGMGLALHQWGGGGAQDKQVACIVNPDGSVELRSATQDIGTGARTILAIIAAEVLGLEVGRIKSNIGNSTFPPGQSSGGSTTTPSMAPPCLDAATKARDELFRRIAPGLEAAVEDLSLKGGKVLVKGEEKLTWEQACRKLGMMPINVIGQFAPGLASTGVGGCQFVEAVVDVETGVVRLKKIVAVQDSGLILDMLTWRSQIYGGVIGGLNYGLFEERIMDEATGVMLNPDMEMYKLAGATDIPEIVIEAYDTPEMRERGVIGVGEPPTISTAAAIGNAVANAIGVRVPKWPMSPMNVLDALASKEGKA
ncbi:xanthine dehydrogenase family protein molybdopterin-binding subunit [Planctomyces sp. SH-PL62]|uniref:xanthine dehydrogenase family protein molybdopterin-binding subunit n=1 Tax=Planctomyces sp. SH-PL62 TaxID=1636152 RepID=UPI00078C4637|nr:xanthine dehydrogenase family protein molybdopterin-binding subunit [Planctomyces sp. SH-PL62]AMV38798.1 Xanthine dehydrogenase molybdenum-binding subunit [Planctomyces sp. SH-PL62]